MRIVRALACAAVVSSMALATLAGPVGAAGKTIVVDNDGVQCKKPDYNTISAAVAAAPAGAKIQVCAGTYTEQVTIPAGKNGLSLESKPDLAATIKAPAVMVGNKAIVEVTGSQNVSISGFTISGPGGGPCDSLRYGVRLSGNASATIEKNHITLIQDAPFSGCQNGIAVLVGRVAEGAVATGYVRNNVIDAYQKGGVVVSNIGSYGEIDRNTIVGVGPTATIAANGIQVSGGATADVHHNTVTDNQFTPMTFASAGILVFSAGAGVEIDHNTVLRADEGFYLIDADGVDVHHNESSQNTFDGFGLDDTDGAALAHNEADDNGYDGIWVDSDANGNTFDHNKMFGNAVFDAEDLAFPTNTWSHTQCDDDFPAGQIC